MDSEGSTFLWTPIVIILAELLVGGVIVNLCYQFVRYYFNHFIENKTRPKYKKKKKKKSRTPRGSKKKTKYSSEEEEEEEDEYEEYEEEEEEYDSD